MINPRNSHSPLPDDRRKRCPICHQRVYSPAGIHPQCAIKQVDPWLSSSAVQHEPSSDGNEPRTDPPAPVEKAKPKIKEKAKPALAAKRVNPA